MAGKGDTVYVLRTWETDGYHSFDRHLEIFLSEFDAKVRGSYLQECFHIENKETTEFINSYFSVVAKELS